MAERFLWALEQKGISQRELARRLNTNPVFLSKLGTGKSKKTRMVVDIALALDVTPEWLEYGIENNRSESYIGIEQIYSANQTFIERLIEKIEASHLSVDNIHSRTLIAKESIEQLLSGQYTLTLVESLLLCELFKCSIYDMVCKPNTTSSIPLIGGTDIIKNIIAPVAQMEADFASGIENMVGILNDGSFSGRYIDKGKVVIVDAEVKAHNIQSGDSCLFLVNGKIDIGINTASQVRSLNFFSDVFELSEVVIIGKVAFLELNPTTSNTTHLLKRDKERFIQAIKKIIPDGTLEVSFA
ncbi:helix-turn-helix domain-containing protein [Vibrio sp. S4M6]|uniref:helix-turn-helix domain-containing protein n=1 Tax=Vibrio sinus TaxID=2946865 RepID=UPI002029BC8F|nr:helix-turn-helix domain-containing protein [Vibrio sinus]MCL9782653.1 helix-turn-helix domain-containing protein [Vibrio sinus]